MKPEIKQRIEQLNNGEIPYGYKKTEFGIFPYDWEVTNIGKFCNVYSGGTPSTSKSEYWNGDIPWCSPTDITKSEKYIVKTDKYISKEGLDNSSAVLMPVNSILMCSRATIGPKCINKVPMATNQGFKNLVCKRPKDTEYVYYLLDNLVLRFIKASNGSTFLELSKSELEKARCCIPKTEYERTRIADILMKWDEAIELQELLIERRETLCARYIELLLTPKAGWIRTALGKVIEEISITTTENNQHEVVSSTKKGLFAQKEYFDKQIASENNVGYKVLRKGNIVLSPQNLWLGNINYNDVFEIGIVSPSYKIFEVKKDFDELFVAALMKTPRMLHQYVLASEQGASVVRRNLNMELFYDIPLFIPSLQEQKRISSVFRKLTDILKLENDKLESMKRQRKALQQYLLNGIVRV